MTGSPLFEYVGRSLSGTSFFQHHRAVCRLGASRTLSWTPPPPHPTVQTRKVADPTFLTPYIRSQSADLIMQRRLKRRHTHGAARLASRSGRIQCILSLVWTQPTWNATGSRCLMGSSQHRDSSMNGGKSLEFPLVTLGGCLRLSEATANRSAGVQTTGTNSLEPSR
jgi:hypothetical protein